MIYNTIEGSITKASIKKLGLNRGEYESAGSGVIISNYLPTILYLPFKIINPDTRIGVSNLKDEICKATQAKFVNYVKDLLDHMYSN